MTNVPQDATRNMRQNMEKMTYLLKHFDTELIKFNITSSAIDGLSIEIIESNDRYNFLFPIGLELTNNGLLKWLKRI